MIAGSNLTRPRLYDPCSGWPRCQQAGTTTSTITIGSVRSGDVSWFCSCPTAICSAAFFLIPEACDIEGGDAGIRRVLSLCHKQILCALTISQSPTRTAQRDGPWWLTLGLCKQPRPLLPRCLFAAITARFWHHLRVRPFACRHGREEEAFRVRDQVTQRRGRLSLSPLRASPAPQHCQPPGPAGAHQEPHPAGRRGVCRRPRGPHHQATAICHRDSRLSVPEEQGQRGEGRGAAPQAPAAEVLSVRVGLWRPVRVALLVLSGRRRQSRPASRRHDEVPACPPSVFAPGAPRAWQGVFRGQGSKGGVGPRRSPRPLRHCRHWRCLSRRAHDHHDAAPVADQEPGDGVGRAARLFAHALVCRTRIKRRDARLYGDVRGCAGGVCRHEYCQLMTALRASLSRRNAAGFDLVTPGAAHGSGPWRQDMATAHADATTWEERWCNSPGGADWPS